MLLVFIQLSSNTALSENGIVMLMMIIKNKNV